MSKKKVKKDLKRRNGIIRKIKANPSSISSYELNEENCLAAVETDGLALKYIPEINQTENICLAAVRQNASAVQYVSKGLMTEKIRKTAMDKKVNAVFVPKERMIVNNKKNIERSLEEVISALEKLVKRKVNDKDIKASKIVAGCSAAVLADFRVVCLLRKVQYQYFVRKKYSEHERVFITEERTFMSSEIIRREFTVFEEFYVYTEDDLKGADLRGFDFEGIDIRKYDIKDATISSDVLEKCGLYDDSFYNRIICKSKEIYYDSSTTEGNDSKGNLLIPEPDVYISYKEGIAKFYYISDIHLNHRIMKEFPVRATKNEIRMYIHDMVDRMCRNIIPDHFDFLLVAGDVSFNAEIARMFYSALARRIGIDRSNIIVVLANHEVWDWSGNVFAPQHSLDEVIEEYRKMCRELGITFLHNDLLTTSIHGNKIINEKCLNDIECSELRSVGLKSMFFVLGGLGFSGMNPDFNAASGLYRQNMLSIEEDIRQSKRFEAVYKKVEEAFGNERVIVLTHMPKENWTDVEYNPDWVYVSGHTHRNEFFCDEKKTIYADNQIGYNCSIPLYLKHFSLARSYDIFRFYADGIYTISRDEYIDFYRGQNLKCSFTRQNGSIVMLKRNRIYCFLFRNSDSDTYYLLNGGQMRKLANQSPEYYYDNMVCYYYGVHDIFDKYYTALKKLSDIVKKVGGRGTMHGCIVDIDYYNHIFLDPQSGSVTPYFAESMVDKWEYKNIEALLLKERPDLYEKYRQLLLSGGVNAIAEKIDISSDLIPEFVPETFMYKSSRLFRTVQYMRDIGVIRIWSDKIVEAYADKLLQSKKELPKLST